MLSVKTLLEKKTMPVLWSVRPDQLVLDALELMATKNIGAVLVMDGAHLAGIFSERDYARKGILKGREAKSTPITEVMTANVFTVTPDMNIQDCMELFSEKRIRHLPVKDGDRIVGLLSIGDIVTAIIEAQSTKIEYLEQYINMR